VSKKDLIDGQKILIVDDEPDILETLEELLPMCHLKTASTFEEGKEYLEGQEFDLAILDIMGVDGYHLLEIAKEKGVIPVMLTAHALSPEHTIRSYKGGAASYVPKEEMGKIRVFLNDILEAKEKGENFWWRWFDRLGPFYDRTFGPDWKKKDKEFWKKLTYI
jgi:DNA-binding NtrC family response regulator